MKFRPDGKCEILPPGVYSRWVWDFGSESWVCGTPNNGAGVFYEDGHNQECPEGFYFGMVVDGEIKALAHGPYATRGEAMDEVGKLLVQFKVECGGYRADGDTDGRSGARGHLGHSSDGSTG